MRPNIHYDIIGDIHGQYDKLTALLDHLGYLPHAGHYRHPEGRRIIFLGDYIDRGPKIRETLQLVRAMVNAGAALAIMGNHELNAILYHKPDSKGGHLRPHSEKNTWIHAATLNAFAGRKAEYAGWIEWMEHLPFFLDLGELRAVHAAWAADHIAFLGNKTLLDPVFLHAVATSGTPEFKAVETVLKGPELVLPEGLTFLDKEGIARKNIRVRWWNVEPGLPLGELALPEPIELDKVLHPAVAAALPNYPAHDVPVFAGHYWLPAHAPKKPVAKNIAILDFSAGQGTAPLFAYRWNGGGTLTPERFVTYNTGA